MFFFSIETDNGVNRPHQLQNRVQSEVVVVVGASVKY